VLGVEGWGDNLGWWWWLVGGGGYLRKRKYHAKNYSVERRQSPLPPGLQHQTTEVECTGLLPRIVAPLVTRANDRTGKYDNCDGE